MSFPIMPRPTAPPFRKGELAFRQSITVNNTTTAVPIGNASEDRTVIVMAIGASGGGIPVWGAPTINGVAMVQVAQDAATAGDDGQRGAIWVLKVPQGANASIFFNLPNFSRAVVFTMTGVRNPTTGFVTRTGSGSITNPTPACAIFYAVDNFGSISSITNMVPVDGQSLLQADYLTDADTTTYTITQTRTYLLRFVSWAFDY